ncbi:MAG: glycosyltransferase [Bacillota bacterium]
MSTPQCSLLVYLNKDEKLVPAFMQDLRSFFQKFPLQYEVIVLVEKKASATLIAIKTEKSRSPKNEQLIVCKNDKNLGRALSLYRGIDMARAPFVMILDSELASPFGDIFKLWQHLVAEEKIDICWGDRYRKKESPFNTAPTARLRTERLFNGILRDKYKDSLQDPLCEVFALKKAAWDKIRDEVPLQNVRGWYLSPALHASARLQTLNIIEIPVYDSGATSKSYSVWKERLNLLKDSILK